MRSGMHVGLAVALLCLGFAATAEAGMGAITLAKIRHYLTLSKLAKLRLDAISFFLVGLLTSDQRRSPRARRPRRACGGESIAG